MPDDENDAFRRALELGDVQGLSTSIEAGANINQLIDGQHPLIKAISDGEEDIAVSLINHGVDISVSPINIGAGLTSNTVPAVQEAYGATREKEVRDRLTEAIGKEAITVYDLSGRSGIQESLTDNHGETTGDDTSTTLGALSTVGLQLCFQFAFDFTMIAVCSFGRWPGVLGTFQRVLVSRTIIGYALRSDIVVLGYGIVNREGSLAWDTIKMTPAYAVFYSLARPYPETQLTLTAWKFGFKSFGLGVLKRFQWSITHLGSRFVIEITDAMLQSFIFGEESNPKTDPISYTGEEAIREIIKRQGVSSRISTALLDKGVFSQEYIQAYLVSEHIDSPIAQLWWHAAEYGHTEIIRKLVHLGIPPHFSGWKYDDTALEVSAMQGHHEMVCFLLEQPNFGNKRQYHLDMALLVAAREQSYTANARQRPIIATLLASGANVNAVNENKRTLISLAFECEDPETFDIILEWKPDLNIPDVDGKTPIFHCWVYANMTIMERVIIAGADINHVDNDGMTLLHKFLRSRNSEGAMHLIKLGANIQAVNNKGETALHLAARYCDRDIITLLIDMGLDIDGRDGSKLSTPLLEASWKEKDRSQNLAILLERGANPNAQYPDGRTSLHIVCQESSHFLKPTDDESSSFDQLLCLQTLLRHGADPNAILHLEQKNGLMIEVSALGIACSEFMSEKIRYDVIEALLEAGAKPNGLGHFGVAAITQVSSREVSEKTSLFQLLLRYGADCNYVGKDGFTLLHFLAMDSTQPYSAESMMILSTMRSSISLSDSDKFGRTALHIASCHTNWTTMAQYDGEDDDPFPLHGILQSDRSDELLMALVDNGIDLFAQDMHGSTALHIAASCGNPSICAFLLWKGKEDLLNVVDSKGRTAMHYAVNSPEVTRVFHYYIAINDFETKHFYSRAFGDGFLNGIPPGLRETLLTHHEDFKDVDDKANAIASFMLQNVNPGAIKTMLNAKDDHGNTPLHYAALIGNSEVVEKYVTHSGINLLAKNKDGDTALDFAFRDRNCSILIKDKMLQLKLVPPNPKNSWIKSANGVDAQNFVLNLQRHRLNRTALGNPDGNPYGAYGLHLPSRHSFDG